MRPSGRKPEELRAVRLARGYTRHAEGSVLVEFGDTKVLCTASVLGQVPPFLRDKGRGWVTAEGEPFARAGLDGLLALAARGIAELVAQQRRALGA